MSEEAIFKQEEKSKKSMKPISPVFLTAANTFAVVYASIFGIAAAILAVINIVDVSKMSKYYISGTLTFPTVFYAVSAIIFGLIAFFTMKKLTDTAMLKKAYAIAAAFLSVAVVLFASAAITTVLYAIFAAGAGAAFQKLLWLHMFLPFFGITAILAGIVCFTKSISDGKIKLLPPYIYTILGISGLGFILGMVATFIGLY